MLLMLFVILIMIPQRTYSRNSNIHEHSPYLLLNQSGIGGMGEAPNYDIPVAEFILINYEPTLHPNLWTCS